MEILFIALGAEILGLFIVYLLLKRFVQRSVSPEFQVEQVREEVDRIIVDLNQTTDRSITLIEDRLNNLMDLLSKADKKMSLLRRESEKHDAGSRLYSQLATTRQKQVEKPARLEKEQVKEEVVKLYRAGISPHLIASRMGATVGEVELIISLEQRKGQGWEE